MSFDFPRDTSLEPIMVSMKRLGRISSLKEIIPEEEMIDEVSDSSLYKATTIT